MSTSDNTVSPPTASTDTATPSLDECCIAYDFEAPGGIPGKHAFSQLGAVLFNMSTGKVLRTFNHYANLTGYCFEERCVREFWSKFPQRHAETIEECSKSPLSPYDVVALFHQTCLEWVREYPNTIMITDNAGYDAALLKFFSPVDTMYFLGPCQCMLDTRATYLGMTRLPVTYARWDSNPYKYLVAAFPSIPPLNTEGVSHDHHPVNDATVIAMKWHHINKHLHKMV